LWDHRGLSYRSIPPSSHNSRNPSISPADAQRLADLGQRPALAAATRQRRNSGTIGRTYSFAPSFADYTRHEGYLRGSGAVYRDTLLGGLYLLNEPFAGVPISGGGLVLSGAVARSGVISGTVQPVTCSVTKLNMRPQDSHHWYAT